MNSGSPTVPTPPAPADDAGPRFPEASEAEWRVAATRALGGRSPDELIGYTRDGIPVLPVYSDRAAGRTLFRRGTGAGWKIIQRIDAADPAEARRQIGEAFGGGADGVELVLATSPLARGAGLPAEPEALRAVVPPGVSVRIDAGRKGPGLAAALLDARTGVTVVFDPLADNAVRGPAGWVDSREALVGGWTPAVGLAVADGRVWHDAGATEAQELAALLGSAVGWLREAEAAGHRLASAWERMSVVAVATPEVMLSIAKLRAARLLFARLHNAIGIDAPPEAPIHVETSWRRTAGQDPEMNLLRGAAAAFAAAVGGADSIAVLPFDNNPRARRLARNTALVLRSEARLGGTDDAAAGSGAVEALTTALARAAWRLFQEMEANGGLAEEVRSGAWEERIAAAAAEEEDAVRRGDIVLVGANRYQPAAARSQRAARSAASFLRPRLGDLVEAVGVPASAAAP